MRRVRLLAIFAACSFPQPSLPLHLCLSPCAGASSEHRNARVLQRGARVRARARACKWRAARLASSRPSPLRACAEPPDADLASAWFDDADASVLRDGDTQQVTPQEALRLANAAEGTIVDLRTRLQHAQSSPPGSVSIPAGEPGALGLLFHFRESFEADVLDSVRDGLASPLLLLCDVGVVSGVAASKLTAAGLANARIISGGYEAWQMDPSLPCDEPQAPPSAVIDDSDVGLVPFSLWAEDEGKHPCEPALHIDLGDEAMEMTELAELDDKEEDDGDLDAAQDVDLESEPPSSSSRDLDLAELEQLLGEDGGMPPSYPVEPARVEASPPASALPPAAAPATGSASSPERGSTRGKYYAASTTSYGGLSRVPKGVKLRRTRGGLPPAWLVDIEHLDIAAAIEEDTLSTLSIKELKSFLYYRDAILSGPKRVLIDRIKEVWLQEQAGATTTTTPAEQPQPGGASEATPMRPDGAAAGGKLNGASGANAALEEVLGAEAADAQQGGNLLEVSGSSQSGPHDDFMIDEVFSAM